MQRSGDVYLVDQVLEHIQWPHDVEKECHEDQEAQYPVNREVRFWLAQVGAGGSAWVLGNAVVADIDGVFRVILL
jgi:hypothetical protein